MFWSKYGLSNWRCPESLDFHPLPPLAPSLPDQLILQKVFSCMYSRINIFNRSNGLNTSNSWDAFLRIHWIHRIHGNRKSVFARGCSRTYYGFTYVYIHRFLQTMTEQNARWRGRPSSRLVLVYLFCVYISRYFCHMLYIKLATHVSNNCPRISLYSANSVRPWSS